MRLKSFAEIYGACSARPARRVAVAGADDPLVCAALTEAFSHGFISGGVLAGKTSGFINEYVKAGLPAGPDGFREAATTDDFSSCAAAVAAVKHGECHFLMKGQVHTDEFMRAVLNKETGIVAKGTLSQTGVYEVPALGRLLLVADVGIVISPTLQNKVDILNGAVRVARALKIEVPRAGLLSCVETVNPAVPGSADAACLSVMAARGQIKDVQVDGPLALDNAISAAAAAQKGIVSPVAGHCDILIAPDLNAGNMLAKSIIYLTGSRAAGVVTGASCPVVLTSRADSPETRVNSIAVAALL